MLRLLQPKNRMVSTTPTKSSCYISSLAIIQGDVDPTDVSLLSLLRLRHFDVNLPSSNSLADLLLSLPSSLLPLSPLFLSRSTNLSSVSVNDISSTSSLGDQLRSRSLSLGNHPTSKPRIVSLDSCSRTILPLPPYVSLLILLTRSLRRRPTTRRRLTFDRLPSSALQTNAAPV